MGNPSGKSGIGRLLAEAQRRHVVRFVLGYAAAAFVVLQLAEIVFPAFGLDEDGLRVLVVMAGLGFLPALVLAWIYDVTTEGIKRTDEDRAVEGGPSRLAIVALAVVTVIVTGGLAAYLADQGVFSPTPTASRPTIGPVRTASYDPGMPIRSLAVLPLDDFSPSGDQAYFTSGMHEELIAKLSMLEGMRVVSRTTVMRYADATARPSTPEIGRELGVDALVEGSVSRSDALVRVTLQIIHAPSDSHIRTLQWERAEIDDVLAFQTEIARSVAEELAHDPGATFGDAGVASVDPSAQDAYLRGRAAYGGGTAGDYRTALAYFQDALAEDPDFAAAKAGVAGARFLVGLETPETFDEQLALAREEAYTALEMDSTSMEAREVLSLIERSMPALVGDVAVPEPPSVPRIQVFTGSDAFDSISVDLGTWDTTWVGAITSLGERIEARVRDRALRGRALSPRARDMIEAGLLMTSGRYPDAIRVLNDLVEDDPSDLAPWDMLVRSQVAGGDVEAAVATVHRWHESGAEDAPDSSWVRRLEESVDRAGADGFWEWRLDRLTMHQGTGRDVPRVELAAAHAALGNGDEAFEYLAQALARGEPGLLSLRLDPVWDDLRSDPRFRRISGQAQSLRFAPARRPSGSGGR
jgi:TolB-like protein